MLHVQPSGRMASRRHVRTKSGARVCVLGVRLVCWGSMPLISMAGDCPAVDVRWGESMCSAFLAVTAGCGVVWEGGDNCLTYPPALSILARVLMPPSRASRNFGVGRAVYGPMEGYTPFLVGQSAVRQSDL